MNLVVLVLSPIFGSCSVQPFALVSNCTAPGANQGFKGLNDRITGYGNGQTQENDADDGIEEIEDSSDRASGCYVTKANGCSVLVLVDKEMSVERFKLEKLSTAVSTYTVQTEK